MQKMAASGEISGAAFVEKTEKIKPSLEEVYLKCMRGI